MKIRSENLKEKQRIRTLDALYTATASVRGRAAMKLFLRDLLTESERIMLGRRILIARELIAGRSYPDIAQEMRVGFDTIHRVDRWLRDQLPGYEQAIRGFEQVLHRRADKRMYAQSALYRLKKKYPLHFLLFPWPKGSPVRAEISARTPQNRAGQSTGKATGRGSKKKPQQ